MFDKDSAKVKFPWVAFISQPKLVESREAIKPRPSLLDLDVPLSVHPAPDIL